MRYVSNHIRFAIVRDVDYDSGIVRTIWMDNEGGIGPDVPIPHPFAGKGGEGVFVGIRSGSLLALDMAASERYVPVAVMPLRAYYGSDLSGVSEIQFDDVGYPLCREGDVVIQGVTGSQLCFNNDGNIELLNAFGEGVVYCGDSDDAHRCTITISSPAEYRVSQYGHTSKGIVRRDVRIDDSEEDFVDFLTDPDSEQALEEIGWDPGKQVSLVSRQPTSSGDGKATAKNFRNAAFVENREVIFEFARNWAVGRQDEELDRLKSDLVVSTEADDRRERRSNTLSLTLTDPNELLERTYGTVIDIFGNMLDINRDIIPLPKGEKEEDFIRDVFEKARHTIAYHMEINTRKGWGYREPIATNRKPILLKDSPNVISSANNSRDRSRWHIDIDKEGLTKINIPSTSETGNVPLLTRYENSSTIEVDERGIPKPKARENSKGLFRNSDNKDIFLDQFGPGGIKVRDSAALNRLKGKLSSWKDVTNQQATLPDKIEAGTAFHDITQTAITLLKEDINKTAKGRFKDDDVVSPDLPAVSSDLDPRVPVAGVTIPTRDGSTGLVSGQPNAGGRSAQINLDGSLELSIGANTVDRVAWTLDTAGALVARLGRDRQGRSAIIQSDGSIVIEVGGFDFVGESATDEVDTRFVGRGESRSSTLPGDPTRFKGGKMVIRIRRANTTGTGPDSDGDDHFLIIDDSGLSIESAGRINLISKGDLALKSGGTVIIDGKNVQFFEDNPRHVIRSGRVIT